METKDNFYENLGTYYSNTNKIYEKINSKIFNDVKLVIKIIGLNKPQEEISSIYKIEKIEISQGKDDQEFNNSQLVTEIECINDFLKSTGDKLGYKNEINSWSLFYLIKEMITSFQKLGYNFYRGQNKNFETIPGIFRNLKNNENTNYYDVFESLYIDISREFPDNVTYVPLTIETLDERADELSILQHYGLKTSLLDISENPFVAMLFMLGFDSIDKPQLEFYKIEHNEDSKNGLISFVHKKNSNKRIKAQRGAFINFDKLIKFVNFQKNEIKLKGYKPIDRIIIQIEFDTPMTINYLKEQKNLKLNNVNNEAQEQTKNLSDKELDDLIKLLENDDDNDSEKKSTVNDYYSVIQKELLRKLKEFNYETNNLFPDFSDYLDYKSKEFKTPEEPKNRNLGIGQLKESKIESEIDSEIDSK